MVSYGTLVCASMVGYYYCVIGQDPFDVSISKGASYDKAPREQALTTA